MRVALNCYIPSTPTGLGTLCRSFCRNLPLWQLLPGPHPRFSPQVRPVKDPLEGVECLMAIERCLPGSMFRWAKEAGIRTVLVVMHEWLSKECPWFNYTDLFVAPSHKAYEEVIALGVPREKVVRATLPLNLEELPFRQRQQADRFIFSNGWGGVHQRKGLAEVKAALDLMTPSQRAHVTIASQAPISEANFGWTNVAADLYTNKDVAICPSRTEGLGLSILEAMAMGLPVLATDAPPMNEYINDAYGELAGQCLIQVAETRKVVNVGKEVTQHICSPDHLKRLIGMAHNWDENTVKELSNRGRRYIEDCWGLGAAKRLWEVITDGAS